MENLETKHLAEDIAQACQDIIKKETVHKVTSNEDADKALEEAKKDPRANQEILQELSNKFFYIQNKAHLIIEVFKEIAEDQIYMSEKEKIPSLFEGTREIIEKNHSYYLSLQPGDIQLFLQKSDIETKISESKQNRKCRAWILGEHCFVQKENTEKNHTKIIEATQSDLVWILEGLKKLL